MSTIAVNAVTDANGGNTATINGMTPTADSLQGFRNRIINGNMRIDQRNAGASVTIGSGNTYTLDRWLVSTNQASKFTVEQTVTGVAAPTGFSDYLAATSSSAYSVLTGDYFNVQQRIEGFNMADLEWGTANAKTITISFWVRSSLTGTFGGAIKDSTNNYSYPYTYTISAANTWEQKTVTIVGPTAGTWSSTTGIGMQVLWSLGAGATYSGTAGAWAASDFRSATGAVSVVGTNTATWYITGVQIEVGSVATPFERRDYGRELILCQRYYQRDIYAVVGGGATPAATNRSFYCAVNFPVQFRATPTMTLISTINSTNMNAGSWDDLSSSRGRFSATNSVANDCFLRVQFSGSIEL